MAEIAEAPLVKQVIDPEAIGTPPDDIDDIEPGTEMLGEEFQDETGPYQPGGAWLAWECAVERITDYHQFRHKPLNATVTQNPPTINPLGQVTPVAENTSPPIGDWTTDVPDIIQQTSSPSLMLRLRGFGVRAAYRVNAPKLISYGGQPATLKYERVIETQKGDRSIVQLYRTDWDLVYLIAYPTSSIPLPADPLLGLDGQ